MAKFSICLVVWFSETLPMLPALLLVSHLQQRPPIRQDDPNLGALIGGRDWGVNRVHLSLSPRCHQNTGHCQQTEMTNTTNKCLHCENL